MLNTQHNGSMLPPLLLEFLDKEVASQRLSADLAELLATIAGASSSIQQALLRLSWDLENLSGRTVNASGDTQQPLDIVAQAIFVTALKAHTRVHAIISEESESVIYLHREGQYIVSLDPLDGSGNLRTNAPVGTLFAIYQKVSGEADVWQGTDSLLVGRKQILAGYLLYSACTMLVYGTPTGVHGFTYDPALNNFRLTHPAIKIPAEGASYAINHGYVGGAPRYIQAYIAYAHRQGYASRYTGALVADFHRHLIEGGIYLYPPTAKHPRGKLRLVYECNVLAFMVAQAGGLATDGNESILDIIPDGLHQRVPLYIGSPIMVKRLLEFKVR